MYSECWPELEWHGSLRKGVPGPLSWKRLSCLCRNQHWRGFGDRISDGECVHRTTCHPLVRLASIVNLLSCRIAEWIRQTKGLAKKGQLIIICETWARSTDQVFMTCNALALRLWDTQDIIRDVVLVVRSSDRSTIVAECYSSVVGKCPRTTSSAFSFAGPTSLFRLEVSLRLTSSFGILSNPEPLCVSNAGLEVKTFCLLGTSRDRRRWFGTSDE